jgi:hypothetical protein
MMRFFGSRVGLLLLLLFTLPSFAAEEQEKKHPHRGGTLRLGPYHVTGIKTQVQLDDANAPPGKRMRLGYRPILSKQSKVPTPAC